MKKHPRIDRALTRIAEHVFGPEAHAELTEARKLAREFEAKARNAENNFLAKQKEMTYWRKTAYENALAVIRLEDLNTKQVTRIEEAEKAVARTHAGRRLAEGRIKTLKKRVASQRDTIEQLQGQIEAMRSAEEAPCARF